MDTASDEREVRITLRTALPRSYLVTDAPIAVPGSLRRKALSQMINSMLDLDGAKPFDFLVDGEFLRSSLNDYIASKGKSTEEVVDVEYILAAAPPQPSLSIPHDDWISSLACIATSEGSAIVSGCYDNQVRMWQDGECTAVYSGHTRSVKAVVSVPSSSDEHDIASTSMDETVRIWQRSRESPRVLIGKRHNGTVESVAAQPTGNMIATGGWDHLIHLWSTNPDDEDIQQTQPRKRRKGVEMEEVTLKSSLAVYTGSGGVVNALSWPQEATLFSAGADHCVRQWDVSQAKNVNTMVGSKVINALAMQPSSTSTLAGAEFDGNVRLYDCRLDASKTVTSVLKCHTGPCMDVAWNPTNAHQLATVGVEDSMRESSASGCKQWDIRSPKIPLFRLPKTSLASSSSSIPDEDNSAEEERMVAVVWCSDGQVAFGGAAGQLYGCRT
eukprot:TRINITY_DN9683_c0_g1_i1.p1 TRINITY_DN9683_c0_g1~~TRINITY_DN9683_c0_g1_i1.p1  ORF type:complete len:442 (+),score=54.15 TRINITY_DN9683_c0_g1_i1:1197-2522(+)